MLKQIKTSLSIVIVLVCMGAIANFQFANLSNLSTFQQKSEKKEEYQKAESRKKITLNFMRQAPTLGFDNLIADFVFLDFLQYFGDNSTRKLLGYKLCPIYYGIIVDRDPHFLSTYSFLSNCTTVYAGQPERSVTLLAKGLHSLAPKTDPKAYYLWRYKAITELLFLGQPQAARRSFEKASEWASHFNDIESQNVAQLSRQTAQFLRKNPNSIEAQITSWYFVLISTTDKEIKKLATQKIEALGGRLVLTPKGTLEVRFYVKNK